MNKRRLRKLADLLEADAKTKNGIKFDFFEWGSVDDVERPLSCGTYACAMGLAALSGAFKRAGLGYTAPPGRYSIDFTINGRARNPIKAAMHVFDISKRDAEYLFTSSIGLQEVRGAAAERAVAKRLRDFCDRPLTTVNR
jgi:hypothetical protein